MELRLSGAVGLLFYLLQLPLLGADALDTWRVRTSGTTNTLYMVNYGNTQFVAVGAARAIRTSPDGVTWTGRTSTAPGDIYAVAYGGGLWAACGPNGLIMTSPNGIAWTSRASETMADLYNIAYGNGRFVAVGSTVGSSRGTMITSSNGLSWSATDVLGAFLNGVTFGNNRFVGVGLQRQCSPVQGCFGSYLGAYTSESGDPPWISALSPVSQTTFSLIDVTYGAGTFVTVGAGGSLLTSQTGSAWTQLARPVNTDLNSCTFGAGSFVMVGAGGLIFSSTNGSAWTPRASPTSTVLYEVTYGNKTFVTVGDGGTILQSERLLTFSISSVTLAEGDTGNREAVFTVTVDPAPSATVDVNYATGNGMATAGEDYVATNGVLTFQAGQTSQVVRVGIVGDTLPEPDETFFVTLSNPVSSGSLEVSQGIGTIFDDEAPLRVVQSPESRTVNSGSNVTFSVQILSRFPPVTYQWQLNGMTLLAATNDALTIVNAQSENDGIYRVIVRDNAGNETSASAQLSVLAVPAFVQHPVGLSVPMGGRATFSAQITGNPPPFTYIWQKQAVPFLTNVSDQRMNFLVLSNVQPSQAGGYRVVVKNALNSSTIGVGSTQVILAVLPDTDADGLPDTWETTHGVTDPVADPDLDTMSNLSEYIAGTDPQNGQSNLRVDGIHVSGNARVEFVAASNTTYTVQRRDTVTGLWSRMGDVVSRPTNRTAIVIDTATGTNAFYRLVTPWLVAP